MEFESKIIHVERALLHLKKESFEGMTDESKRHFILAAGIGFANMVGLAKGVIEKWQIFYSEEENSDVMTILAAAEIVSDEGFGERLEGLEKSRFEETSSLDEFIEKLLVAVN